jgi:uncharacterized protein (TIGR02147 family)
MQTPSYSYRNILSTELDRRKELNALYSLRAFARDMGLAAPQLSSVMSGKKGISVQAAKKIAKKISLTDQESNYFVLSAQALHSRQPKNRQRANELLQVEKQKKSIRTILEPSFSCLNEWFYISFLQAFDLVSFEPKTEWFAEHFNVSKAQAKKALMDLEEAGLLTQDQDFFKPTFSRVKTADIASKQIRSYLQKMIKIASNALENQSINERDFSATTFAIDPQNIPVLKKKIENFCDELCQAGTEKGPLKEIYCFSTQFFRVSKKSTNKENL